MFAEDEDGQQYVAVGNEVDPEEEKPRKARRKKPLRRPANEIVYIKNKDKVGHEEWDEKRSRDIGNFPSPSRIVLIGACGCGKTMLIKNLILHAMPRYEEVYLIHPDIEHSREFADMDLTAELDEIPDVSYWTPADGKHKKRCLIIDDLEFTSASSEALARLGLLFRYVSTHKSMSIFFSHQSWFNVPGLVKKMSNVFVIWRPKPRNELELITNRVGMKKGDLKLLFDTVATKHRDSICIDMTENTPAPLRLNIWKPIKKAESSDEDED